MYKPKAIVFLGPPGSGKGTQADRLSAALEIPAISTGDILRREAQSPTATGQRLAKILQSGQLVADSEINELVSKRISRKDCRGGFLLDGYPRTVQQAVHLDGTLRGRGFGKPVVFDFIVSADALVERLKWRRQCPTCSRIYGALDGNGRAPAFCVNDRTLLVAREDDQPVAIRERLCAYAHNSAELVRHYEGHEYHQIRAACDVRDVTEQLFEALGLRALVPQPAAPMRLAVSC